MENLFFFELHEYYVIFLVWTGAMLGKFPSKGTSAISYDLYVDWAGMELQQLHLEQNLSEPVT